MTGPEDPNHRWEFRCEDFVYARLAEAQTTADETMLPGPAQDAELNRIDSLYLIAADHNIWVDARGNSAGRCITCTVAGSGVPCQTMRGLARLWRDHPNYVPAWNQNIDGPRPDSATFQDYKQRSTIYTRRAADLLPFYAQFELLRDRNGEYWQCKDCTARGDSNRPLLGSYDYPHAIGDARRQHSTCPERTSP